jgi:chaperonin GroES
VKIHNRTRQIRPIGDKLFVRPFPEPEKTASGLLLPQIGSAEDPTRRRPCTGEVVAVGPGAWTKKLVFVTPDIQMGDHVLFSRFVGHDIQLNGQDILVLAECDVHAVIKPGTRIERFNEIK